MLVLFVSIFIVGTTQAQTDVAEITGAVTDAQGAAVAGATVTLDNPSSGVTRTTQTGSNGIYKFPSIPPATYTITVEKSGFKKSVTTDVKALIATTSEINFLLEIGDVSETVTVTSNTIDSIVNTQDASIGNNFQPIQIQQLPTDSRNVTDLLSLAAGRNPRRLCQRRTQ